MEYKITSHNELDTIELAENIEAEKFPNMVICLNGDLGSGKTIFAKGFAVALGIEENITSPTFTIIKEYEGELPLYHLDVYRLEKDNIGIADYFTKGGVTIVEWSENIKDILPKERLDIKIKMINDETRVIELTPHGEAYENICQRVI